VIRSAPPSANMSLGDEVYSRPVLISKPVGVKRGVKTRRKNGLDKGPGRPVSRILL
jgi:hypothetical protein